MDWIHTKNHLPKEDKYVLVWYNDEPQQVYRDGDEWFWMNKDQSAPIKGTYWMKITPPEE
jgi:hypothetical protein